MPGPKPFPDHRDRLFGRAGDLVRLRERVKHKGVTFVTGRPKMGKTWTLLELARGLEAEGGFLVGYAESTAESPDLVLRAVSDAYERWLQGSNWREQGKSLLARHEGNLLSLTAKFLGRLLGGAADERPVEAGAGGALLESLAEAQRNLTTGGFQLPRLSYDQARELVGVLAELTGKWVVLILDAWEQTPGLVADVGFLRSYLSHLGDWPEGHFMLGVRQVTPEDPALEHARTVKRESAASIEALEPMDVEDPAERGRMTGFLRAEFPAATEEAGNDLVVELVAGYPGVIDRWMTEPVKRSIHSAEDLRREADNGQNLRYSEFGPLFKALSAEDLSVAIRLAMLPPLGAGLWEPLATTIAGKEPVARIASLQTHGLLVEGLLENPSFGHLTRHEAARRWALESFRPKCQVEATDLTARLAGQVDGFTPQSAPFFLALAFLLASAEGLSLTPAIRLLQVVADTILAGKSPGAEAIQLFEQATRGASEAYPDTCRILAIGLVNTLVLAKAGLDLPRRDRLLQELRGVAARAQEDPEVRKWLAMGLARISHQRQQRAGQL